MDKLIQKRRRRARVRSKVRGTMSCPRLTVFRSSNYIYAQLIDDTVGRTIVGVSEKHVNASKGEKKAKTDRAKALGMELAKKASEKKVARAVFDKGSYRYHGRIKALADGAREGGLQL